MYLFVRIVVILICLSGIFYVVKVNKKYQGDSSGREEIVKYFKDQGAVALDRGIKIKDLPMEIAKSNYLLLMVKDKTLIFKNGKYYLNVD